MKIFHIVSNKEWGGGEQYVYDLCQRQRADGIEVQICCKPVEAIMRKYEGAGITVVPMPLGGVMDLRSAWQLASIVSQAGPCVIHAHNFKDAFTAAYARKLSSNKQVRVVMCRHLTRTGKNSLHYRWLYRQLDCLCFDSQLSEDMFLSTGPAIGREKLRIVHTSIMVQEALQPIDVHKEFGLPADCIVGMFHGRLDPEKGLDTLLEAVRLMDSPRFCLILVGKGSDVNKAGNDGRTPLYIATRFGHDEIVKYLPTSAFWHLRCARGAHCLLRSTCRKAVLWWLPIMADSVSISTMRRTVCWSRQAMPDSWPMP